MSILLRKECQPILDKAKLSELHVDIVEKTLTIVGGCGKPLVMVGGIKFGTNNPRAAEIDYASELFEKFIATHGKAIKDYLAKKKAFMLLPKPSLKKYDLISVNHYISDDGEHSKVQKIVQIEDREIYISITSNGEIHLPSTYPLKVFLALVKEVKKAEKTATDYFTEAKKWQEQSAAINKLRDALASCDI